MKNKYIIRIRKIFLALIWYLFLPIIICSDYIYNEESLIDTYKYNKERYRRYGLASNEYYIEQWVKERNLDTLNLIKVNLIKEKKWK